MPNCLEEDNNTSTSVVAPPALLGSCRFGVLVLVFAAMFQMMILRFNLSMAIVCMSGRATKADHTNSSLEATDTDNVKEGLSEEVVK